MIWLAIAGAGAAGAVCRYVVDSLITARTRGAFPWGILAVNLTGAFLIGVVAGIVVHRSQAPELATVLGAGFCGAYTTFSTLVYDTWRLVEERALLRATANLMTLVLSLPAASLGWALVRF